jgi:hypothetical protein
MLDVKSAVKVIPIIVLVLDIVRIWLSDTAFADNGFLRLVLLAGYVAFLTTKGSHATEQSREALETLKNLQGRVSDLEGAQERLQSNLDATRASLSFKR